MSSRGLWSIEENDTFVNFLIDQTKNANSPFNYCAQLCRAFKKKFGSTRSVSSLLAKIRSARLKFHEMKDLAIDTRVRMIFVFGAPVDINFLNELKKDAHVEVDDYYRLIKYENKRGDLKLCGVHLSRGLKNNNSIDTDKQILDFLANKTRDEISPITDNDFVNQFKTSTSASVSIPYLMRRFQSLKDQIYTTVTIKKATRIKMLFVSGAKISNSVLKTLRKEAIVKIDDEQRITSYKAKDGSLEFEREHSVSTEIQTGQDEEDERSGISDAVDEEKQVEEEVKYSISSRGRVSIKTYSHADFVYFESKRKNRKEAIPRVNSKRINTDSSSDPCNSSKITKYNEDSDVQSTNKSEDYAQKSPIIVPVNFNSKSSKMREESQEVIDGPVESSIESESTKRPREKEESVMQPIDSNSKSSKMCEESEQVIDDLVEPSIPIDRPMESESTKLSGEKEEYVMEPIDTSTIQQWFGAEEYVFDDVNQVEKTSADFNSTSECHSDSGQLLQKQSNSISTEKESEMECRTEPIEISNMQRSYQENDTDHVEFNEKQFSEKNQLDKTVKQEMPDIICDTEFVPVQRKRIENSIYSLLYPGEKTSGKEFLKMIRSLVLTLDTPMFADLLKQIDNSIESLGNEDYNVLVDDILLVLTATFEIAIRNAMLTPPPEEFTSLRDFLLILQNNLFTLSSPRILDPLQKKVKEIITNPIYHETKVPMRKILLALKTTLEMVTPKFA